MNGCQFAELIAFAAPTMNSNTTASFTNTIRSLKVADSLIPNTRRVVTTKMMNTAGRLKMAVACKRVAGSVPAALIWSANARLMAVQPAFIFKPAASVAGILINLVPLAADISVGTTMPQSRRNETTYPDQPIATVIAPTAYSRMRSQ